MPRKIKVLFLELLLLLNPAKKILILSELRLLQVALISKSMGIKSPAVDLLYIQENRIAIVQSKRTMNVR